MGGDQLVAALTEVQEALGDVLLPLDLPGAPQARAARAEVLAQLEDYVLPRLRQIEAPLLAVVGGSTGAGKSTLVNSLLGMTVSRPGVLRPTTRSPVLAFNPADERWFDGTRILPGLARTSAPSEDVHALQVVPVESVPAGLAVLDAPDIDSVEAGNRSLAAQLLAAADLWLFVTSAARYADQVPWDFLRRAAERSAAVALVLDRVPPGATAEIAAHLGQMMRDRGLGGSELFTVEEGRLDAEGRLVPGAVAPIRRWLDGLAADAEARSAVVRQTLDGAVRAVGVRGLEVADAHGAQLDNAERLRADVDRAYTDAVAAVGEACADGSLLRGEVLARWQEFVGTGELLRSLETRVGWLRERVTGWVRGRPAQADRVTVAVESGLESLLIEHAERAAEQVWRAWSSVQPGARLLEDAEADPSTGRALGRASRELRGRAERTIRDWQQSVLELVRSEGAEKRSTARFLAFGINGLSVALMVVVFAHTAGLTGAEVGIAGGSAVVGQKVLEAVFGDQAVRRLAAAARTDLEHRVADLYAAEGERYLAVLDGLGLDRADAERLRRASQALTEVRLAEEAAGHVTAPAAGTDPGGDR